MGLIGAQELVEKYGPSVALLNGIAVAHMHQGDFERAEQTLKEALLIDNKATTTLINLVVCAEHQQKSTDLIRRQLGFVLLLLCFLFLFIYFHI